MKFVGWARLKNEKFNVSISVQTLTESKLSGVKSTTAAVAAAMNAESARAARINAGIRDIS